MKKITNLLLIMFLLATSVTFAQTQFAIGIKAGPNFSSIHSDQSAGENYKSRTGFNVGAFALLKFSKVGIQPEVLFSQQGSTFKVPASGSSADFESKFSYVTIPVIVKLYTVAGINIQVGPQIGLLTAARSNYAPAGPVADYDVKDNLKKTDFSVALGLGWDLPFGVTIDGRYNWGLSNIGNSGAGSSTIKNQVWQFSLGYKLFKF